MGIARVLVVDDEQSVRLLLKACLSRNGFEIALAASAELAIEMLDQSHFDLVVSDLRMPGMDGLELLRWTAAHQPETGVMLLSGGDDLRKAVEAMHLGALDYIQKPFACPEVAGKVEQSLQRHRDRLAKDRQVLQLEQTLQRQAAELQASLNRLREASEGTLEALVMALDAREHETLAHSERVSEFTVRLAAEMGVSGPELEAIRQGAMLHDIGKIGISDSILLKPGPLHPDEWTLMRRHPLIGGWIVDGVPSLRGASDIVVAHHEKFDGTGYPHHLKGGEIPLGARVFSVADTLDAMTSERPYHRPRSIEEAREEIRRHAGTQFDPAVVEQFLAIPADEWEQIRVRTQAGRGRSVELKSLVLN